jgi:hypothetical protein
MIKTYPIQGLTYVRDVLRTHIRETGNDCRNEIRIAGRNLAVKLANETWPKNDQGVRKMKDAIASDAARTYATPSSTYRILSETDPARADAYWSLIQNGLATPRRMQSVVKDTPLAGIPIAARVDPAIQRAARTGTRRRVKLKKPRQLLTRDSGMKTHVNRLFRKIGASAAGWAHVAKSLGGTRGIPPYKNIGRHQRATGKTINQPGKGNGIIIHNMVNYVENNLRRYTIDNAIHATYMALKIRLIYATRTRARRTRF